MSAIYQARGRGDKSWLDCSEEAFEHMSNNPLLFETRIVAILQAATREASSADVGHACATKMRATMVRLGAFPGEGLEWFQANIEDNIYLMCREVNKLLDDITVSAPSADAVDALKQIKALVCGDRSPRWNNDHQVSISRSMIADIVDNAIAASAPKEDGND